MTELVEQMSHPLTTCISEIGFLQERIREKNARIEALETALRDIAWLMDGDGDVSVIARSALAEGQDR